MSEKTEQPTISLESGRNEYTFMVYQEQAMRTAKAIDDVSDIMHATLGLCSEAGELATTVKKWMAYGQPLDVKNIVEEVGDIFWFAAFLCTKLNIRLEDVAVNNIAKLYERYPEKFTDQLAADRLDKVDVN